MLNDEQRRHYAEHGYICLENFKTRAQCEALRAAANAIVEAFDADEHRAIFATDDPKRSEDAYFLSSGDKVRCFFEADAFDEAGRLKQAKALSINKIGHAMHDLVPAFHTFSRGPKLADLVDALGVQDPKIWQSMYIFKQPRIGGEVRWHQDATYFYTNPISVVTLWFAIDDATQQNGCLWAAKDGVDTPLRERFCVSDGHAELKTLTTAAWPTQGEAVPLEVEAGTLVCFNGLLPHYSAPNTSAKARHAYTLHVVDGRYHYPKTNWIQRAPEFPVSGFI